MRIAKHASIIGWFEDLVRQAKRRGFVISVDDYDDEFRVLDEKNSYALVGKASSLEELDVIIRMLDMEAKKLVQ